DAVRLECATTVRCPTAAQGGVDRQILLQGAGGHGDFLDDSVAETNRGMDTNIENTTDLPVDDHGNSHDGVQPFILDRGVLLMRDHIGTGVVADTHWTTGCHDPATD